MRLQRSIALITYPVSIKKINACYNNMTFQSKLKYKYKTYMTNNVTQQSLYKIEKIQMD